MMIQYRDLKHLNWSDISYRVYKRFQDQVSRSLNNILEIDSVNVYVMKADKIETKA